MSRSDTTAIMAATLPRSQVVRSWQHRCLDNATFALIAMLGLPGLRIFEACGANIDNLGEEHGHRVLKIRGRATRLS
jgi:hypothetical protein